MEKLGKRDATQNIGRIKEHLRVEGLYKITEKAQLGDDIQK